MKLTRDSAVLGLAAFVAAVGYLVLVGTPPTEWSYRQWLEALSAAGLWVSGKLATSPLKHSAE